MLAGSVVICAHCSGVISGPRRELVATVTSRVINQFIEALPRETLRVLCIDVDLQLGPFRAVSRDNAVARGSRNGVGTGFPSPEVLEHTRFVWGLFAQSTTSVVRHNYE